MTDLFYHVSDCSSRRRWKHFFDRRSIYFFGAAERAKIFSSDFGDDAKKFSGDLGDGARNFSGDFEDHAKNFFTAYRKDKKTFCKRSCDDEKDILREVRDGKTRGKTSTFHRFPYGKKFFPKSLHFCFNRANIHSRSPRYPKKHEGADTLRVEGGIGS